MSADEYWLKLIRRNPQMSCPENKMHITVASFEKQIRAAHAAGVKAGESSRSLFDKLFSK